MRLLSNARITVSKLPTLDLSLVPKVLTGETVAKENLDA